MQTESIHDLSIHEISLREYLSEPEVSIWTGIKPSTLQNHRHLKKGIPFLKYGKKVIYRRQDVLDYLDGCLVKTANTGL